MNESRPMGEGDRRRPSRPGVARILGWTTLVVAAAWVAGAWWVADYVREMNGARVIADLIGRRGGDHGGGGLSMFLPGPRPPPSAAEAREIARLRTQTAWVEGVADGWLKAMIGVGIALAFLGALSLITSRGRTCLLIAALLVFAATAGSLWALHAVADPARGGMELQGNPLAEYLIVAAVQSAYGWLLLLPLVIKVRCTTEAAGLYSGIRKEEGLR